MRALVVSASYEAGGSIVRALERENDVELAAVLPSEEAASRVWESSGASAAIIRLTGGDSDFTLASTHGGSLPAIYVSSDQELALRAFEARAVDFLVEPLKPERFSTAIERLQVRTARFRRGEPDTSARPSGDSISSKYLTNDLAEIARTRASALWLTGERLGTLRRFLAAVWTCTRRSRAPIRPFRSRSRKSTTTRISHRPARRVSPSADRPAPVGEPTGRHNARAPDPMWRPGPVCHPSVGCACGSSRIRRAS